MKTLIKAVALYTAIILSMVWLCSELCLTWLFMTFTLTALSAWCINHITLRELMRMTGYEAWYKFLKK